MRLLLTLLLLIGLAHAESDPLYSDEPEVEQQVLYLSYTDIPKRVFKGEIFSLTVRALSTEDQFEDISYAFRHGHGYKLLTPLPERTLNGRYYIDTFYFLATSSHLRTPTLIGSLRYSEFSQSATTVLEGQSIEVVTLNPPKDFAHILADAFEITNYKTTHYDSHHNIAVFSARAKRCNIEALQLTDIEKQGSESVDPSLDISTITYYAVIPKRLENLRFSYFNLQSESYVDLLIPIIVEEDTVSTQSDLKPTDHRHIRIKITIAAAFALLAFVMFILRKKIFYLFLIIIPAVYIVFAAVPIEYACIKPESPIYLLPMENGTTFEITKYQYTLEVQGSVEGFTKVKLHNNKIGWVRNEDLCVY